MAELVIKLMKKPILHILLVVVLAFLINACDFLKDEDSEPVPAANFTHTLDHNLGGTPGAVVDYFYTFESDVD